MLIDNSVKLHDCIAEWLSTTQFTKWTIFNDSTDIWLQRDSLRDPAETKNDVIPHYMIKNEELEVLVCCPVDERDEWMLKAEDPDFFTKLYKKMEIDEARCI